MLATPEPIVDESGRRSADIVLLKRLRAQVVEQVVASRAYSLDLSYEFGKIRDVIDKNLAYALLRRELEADQ